MCICSSALLIYVSICKWLSFGSITCLFFSYGFACVFSFFFLQFLHFYTVFWLYWVFALNGLAQAILNQQNVSFRATSFFEIVVIFIINSNKMLNLKHNIIQYNAIQYIKIIHSTILIINRRIFTSISEMLSLNRCSGHL